MPARPLHSECVQLVIECGRICPCLERRPPSPLASAMTMQLWAYLTQTASCTSKVSFGPGWLTSQIWKVSFCSGSLHSKFGKVIFGQGGYVCPKSCFRLDCYFFDFFIATQLFRTWNPTLSCFLLRFAIFRFVLVHRHFFATFRLFCFSCSKQAAEWSECCFSVFFFLPVRGSQCCLSVLFFLLGSGRWVGVAVCVRCSHFTRLGPVSGGCAFLPTSTVFLREMLVP